MPRTVALVCLVFAFVGSSNTQVFSLLLVQVAESLGITVSALGGLRTIENLTAISVGVLVAPLVDRYPRKLALATGLTLTTTAAILLVTVDRVWAIPVYFLLNGSGVILTVSSTLALPSDYLSGRALSRMMGLLIGSFAFKSILLLPIAGAVADRAGWRAGFIVSGLLAGVGLALALALLSSVDRAEAAHEADHSYLARYRMLLGRRQVLILLGSALLRYAQYVGFITFLSAMLSQRFGLSLSAIGLLFSTIGATFFCGSLLSAWATERIGPAGILVHGGLLAAACFALGYIVDGGLALTLPALFGLVFVLAVQENVSAVQLLKFGRDARGATMSWSELTASLGGMTGIAIGALSLRIAGVSGLGLTLALFAISGSVISALAMRQVERELGPGTGLPAI